VIDKDIAGIRHAPCSAGGIRQDSMALATHATQRAALCMWKRRLNVIKAGPTTK